ncbi:MAG: WD40 repeat domain-containing protein [Campylobacterales bacterium]
MKALWIIPLLSAALWGLEPVRKIPLLGSAIDTALKGEILITGGDAGAIERFRLGEAKPFEQIVLPPVESLFGPHPPKIYSVDQSGAGALLWIAESKAGEGRSLSFKAPNQAPQTWIAPSENRLLRKARFLPGGGVFAAEVGGVVALLDASGRTVYRKTVMGSSFSDFALSQKGDLAAIAGESGEVLIFDLQRGETLRRLSGGNKDNIYRIDWKSGRVITAGQDRIAAVYDDKSGGYDRFETPFLISAAALSPSAARVAYVQDESGAIAVAERAGGRVLATLRGHYALVGHILFVDENRLITGGDDNFLLEWRIP